MGVNYESQNEAGKGQVREAGEAMKRVGIEGEGKEQRG